MDIRCPSCNTLYEFNEARLKPKGVNLKCSQCGHVFRVEGRKEKTTGSSKRWMVRKIADGEVLYFQGLATLQKWIIDRKVGRQDQISRSGASWKELADIGELSSFFQVAESIERLQQAQSPPSSSGLAAAAATATASLDAPVPEYFDPLAPGDTSIDASMGPISLNSPAEPDVVVTESLKPPPTPLGSTSRDHSTRVSYQESDEQYSPVPLIVAVLILLLLVVGIYIYLKKPEYLGMPPRDKAPIAKTKDTKPLADKGTTGGTAGARPDAKLPDAGDAKSVADKPDAGTGAVAANTDKKAEQADAGVAREEKKADAGTGLVNLNNNANSDTNKGAQDSKGTDQGAGTANKAPDENPTKAVASATPNTDKKATTNNTGGQDKATPEVKPKTTPKVTPKTTPKTTQAVANRNSGKARPAKTRPISGGLMKQGLQALRAGDGKAALDAFERAATSNPGSAAAWRGKGWAYLQLGIPSASIQNFKKALAINPRYGDALIGLARAYRQSGQKGQAISTYQKYLNFYPSGPQASAARAQLERLGGKAP